MPARKAVTVMYAMDSHNLHFRPEHAQRLDQINYSFALIKDGRADASHWVAADRISDFLRRYPQVKGLVSVGGWGADGFSQACATEEGRIRLADSILQLMDEYGFTGVDIDWEYPGIEGTGILSQEGDVERWYELLALLRKGLDERTAATGRKHLLSVALGAGDSHVAAIDPARLNGLVDQAVVMAYDLSGFDRITGHHSGLYPGQNRSGSGARAVQMLIDGGLEPGRILLGMPAYARVWRQVSGGGNGLHQRAASSGVKTISFDDLLRLEEQGYQRYYDEEAQSAWWFDGTDFVSGEDDRSIAWKCAWLQEMGLQGTAVWSMNQDASGAMMAMMDAALR